MEIDANPESEVCIDKFANDRYEVSHARIPGTGKRFTGADIVRLYELMGPLVAEIRDRENFM